MSPNYRVTKLGNRGFAALRACAGSCILCFALICRSAGADISAKFGALTHDIIAPYADDRYVPDPKDRSAYGKAREILKNENLLNTNRPTMEPVPDLSDAYGNALMLGTGVSRVIPEITELHRATISADRAGMRRQIQKIYGKIGRSAPSDATMEKLINAVRNASGAGREANEESIINKPGYKVDRKYSPGTGKVTTEVTGKDGDNPFRAVFSGDVQTLPSASGKAMQLSAKPAEHPRIIDAKESERLARLITGDWTDDENKPWTIELNGSSIILTTMGRNKHPVVYKGTYELGAISALHNVDSPDDIKDDMPDPIKGELANSYHPPYTVHLEVPQEADKLTGTWTSGFVTYSESFMTVKSVHDSYDELLVLKRVPQGGRVRVDFFSGAGIIGPGDSVPAPVVEP